MIRAWQVQKDFIPASTSCKHSQALKLSLQPGSAVEIAVCGTLRLHLNNVSFLKRVTLSSSLSLFEFVP